MAKLMKHRTDNDIKNKWYSMMRTEKKLAEKAKEKSSTQDSASDGLSVANGNENTSSVRAAPTPFKFDNGSRQEYPATTGYATGGHPGEFYLLSTQEMPASKGWPLGNPYGAFYNPQQAHPKFVTGFGGSMMLVDGSGKAIGSAGPGTAGFTRYHHPESARMTDTNSQFGAAYGSGANMFKLHAQPSFTQAHHGAPSIHSTNAAMMPVRHGGNDRSYGKVANHGGENATMGDVEAPEVKSMPRFGDTKVAPSNYDDAPLESNLDVLAKVGLAGGTLGTPFSVHHNEKSFQDFRDPVMPVMSSLNLDSTAASGGGAAVMPSSCVSSPEPSMGAIAVKEEEL